LNSHTHTHTHTHTASERESERAGESRRGGLVGSSVCALCQQWSIHAPLPKAPSWSQWCKQIIVTWPFQKCTAPDKVIYIYQNSKITSLSASNFPLRLILFRIFHTTTSVCAKIEVFIVFAHKKGLLLFNWKLSNLPLGGWTLMHRGIALLRKSATVCFSRTPSGCAF